jgi:hypothetical protein
MFVAHLVVQVASALMLIQSFSAYFQNEQKSGRAALLLRNGKVEKAVVSVFLTSAFNPCQLRFVQVRIVQHIVPVRTKLLAETCRKCVVRLALHQALKAMEMKTPRKS